MLVCAGLPPREMPLLNQAISLSAAEQDLLQSWQAPPAWSSRLLENSDAPTGADDDGPPGRGKFLLKIGGRPGIPFQQILTSAEKQLHDTNKRWAERYRIAREQQEAAEATGAGV